MSTITKEWLQKAISQHESMRDEIPFGLDEDDSNTLAALRIALASLEAEPAIHRWRRVTVEPYGPYPWHYGNFIGFSKPVEGIEDEYYYSAPPVPVSVPDEVSWEDVPEEITEDDMALASAWAHGFNQFRAAMLQGADGNSPVISDGWVACSERMPESNKYVLVCNGVWVGMGLYNDGEQFEDCERWQDEHGEFIDLLHHPVSHWMPLPAAPQQEVK